MAPRFNPPPNWPTPPAGWTPPPGWTPDPSWGPVPPGWQLWTEEGPAATTAFPGVEPAAGVSPAVPGAPLPSVPGVPQPAQKSWVARHKLLTGIGAILAIVVVVSALNGGKGDGTRTPTAGGGTSSTKQSAEDSSAQASADAEASASASAEAAASAAAKAEQDRLAEEARAVKESAAAEAAAAEAARIGTLSQQNAYSQAKSYLKFAPFSRAGLIGQLTSEYGGQFPAADAEFAIARLEAEGGVDWNAEAVEAAQSYQNLLPMSRQELIDQLTSEYGSQFTLDQATYAVTSIGL